MSDFAIYKATIMRLTKGNWVNLQLAKDKAGIKMIATVEDCEKVLAVLTKPKKITPAVPDHVRERYNEAHRLWFMKQYPSAYKEHYVPPVFPKIFTSNGLTTFCINFIEWHGFRAHGIAASGRKVNGKWIPGRTRPGASDISSTIHGRSCMFEIKAGKDKPSDKQIKEQARERKAGGIYEFVYSAEGFLNLFDQLVYG